MIQSEEIEIPLADVSLHGRLRMLKQTSGLVIFVHGSGSSRLSLRNNFVAKYLAQLGLATLLFDLLTEQEEQLDFETRQLRFDIPLLSRRLAMTTSWVSQHPNLKNFPIAYFGASTGAAAALIAAAKFGKTITAVVSRGGRPDLAGSALMNVLSPVLLIVGEEDDVVLELNKSAKRAMVNTSCQLETVPQATHLFEEPGALEQVATIAGQWLVKQFSNKGRLDNPL